MYTSYETPSEYYVPSDKQIEGHLYRGPFDAFSLQTFLNSFIPGFEPIYKVITDILDYNATVLICLCTAFWLFARICRFIWTAINTLLRKYYMFEISVSNENEIFDHLISLFAGQDKTYHRRLIIETL
ncbi:hypothetical protein BDZ45DRAFT_694012 [Acephala macrosclerotiorum]|nr:hypothetical protein BDZ45DRAFT_694012 [Acephala macrosclerotiorum]